MRLVIPIIGGIIISDTVGNIGYQTHIILCVLIPVLALTFFSFICSDRLSRFFGLSLFLSFFLTGALAYNLQMRRVVVQWPVDRMEYQGILTDWPYERSSSYRLDLTLAGDDWKDVRIYLYVPKDSAVKALTPGETVLFRGAVKAPDTDAVPGFDYREYLYKHGVSGTLWVSSANWNSVPGKSAGGIGIRAVKARRAMLERYREWGLDGNSLALVAAVSLGYRQELDESTRELYSMSGVSHLLAVSGLHVGIIYSFLCLLFPLFLNRRSVLWLRELMVICIMWAFAFMTGMSVSIIRSVVMISMFALCRAMGRDSSSVNTLAFAALVMLMADPASLFDIGFRLSFCAVLSILLFKPIVSDALKTRTKAGGWLRDLMAVTVSAQIGTAPITLYSFTGFPTYFMLANLLAIPVMFLMVSFSMILWALSWIPLLRTLTVKGIVFLSDVLEGMLSRIVSLPYSRIDVSIGCTWKVWALYGIIIFVYCWLSRKDTRFLVRALSIVAVWSIVSLFMEPV